MSIDAPEGSTPEIRSSFRIEAQTLLPERQRNYSNLEKTLGELFVGKYGTGKDGRPLLTEEQQRYMTDPQVVTLDRDTYPDYMEAWNPPDIPRTGAVVLNGKVYLAYRPKVSDAGDRETHDTDTSYVGGYINVHGQIPIYVIQRSYLELDVPVSLDAINFREYIRKAREANDLDSQSNAIASGLASIDFATVAVHEKNHGIQDYNLPHPLREAQSYWIQRDLMQPLGAEGRSIQWEGERLADFYGQMVAKYGENVHRLLWGNLEPNESQSLLEALKGELTPEVIASLLPETYEWVTKEYSAEENIGNVDL